MMRSAPLVCRALIRLALVLGLAVWGSARPALAAADGGTADTLEFEPVRPADEPDSETRLEGHDVAAQPLGEPAWLQPPFRSPLSAVREAWPLRRPGDSQLGVALDYNRVDELRYGLTYEARGGWEISPRVGMRLEYTTARHRWLYGAQLEQPLEPGNHVALGFSLYRRTDHVELQQVGDIENTLALLFGRQDYRNYFEREGADAYLALRWPGVTTLSVHGRNDRFRSLATFPGTRSWFHRDRALRDNPPIDEGEGHVVAVRLERVRPGMAGFHHWLELESAGNGLGGDFDYRRLLGDVRSVIRLAPGMTVSLRAVAGHTLSGELPPQRAFTVGGVDGLRAHTFAAFQGGEAALGQAEYSAGIGHFHAGDFDSGLHAIVFVDTGRAWTSSSTDWDVGNQRFAVDGGFGLSTAEDNLRVYFAKNLQDPSSNFVISARIQRPF